VLAALLVLLVTAGGCGVPSSSGVVVKGRGLEQAPAFSDDGTNEPPSRSDTTSPEAFVTNFLAAAAGDPKKAVGRAREFFAPQMRGQWTPEPQVQVIHVEEVREEGPADNDEAGLEVTVSATVLGELGDNGTFAPQRAKAVQYQFKLVNGADRQAGLFVREAPEVVLLSDEALQRYFERRTIYFWSIDRQVLVPDLRYLPRRDVPAAQWPTLIIDWLLRAGPSEWLRPAVEPLPAEARQVGKVPAPADGVLRVELSKAANIADAAQVDRLATQLRWSLRTGSADPRLELGIDQFQQSFTGTDYRAANRAYRSGAPRPRFCLVQGRVRQLGATEDPAWASAVPDDRNDHVVRAALAVSGDRTLVALLRENGRQVVLDVGGGEGEVKALERTELRAASVSQPVWLPGSPDTGIVVADGKLRTFRSSGGPLGDVQNAPEKVSYAAVPPDGRRLAYVAGGRLFVAPLVRVDGGVAMDEPVEVPTTLTALTAVGWSQQDWLVVAGRRGREPVVLQDITVDGAVQGEPRGGQLGGDPVNHLVASTDDVTDEPGAGQVMYMSSNLAYELFTRPTLIEPTDVAGANASPASPSPVQANPTYPFFLG
jgi:hypothetical protein